MSLSKSVAGAGRYVAGLWRPVREFARKLIPSRAIRWTCLYVPAFCAVLLLALMSVGKMEDLVAYVFEAGSRSVPVLIAIAITYGVATGLGWNLDNDERASFQRILVGLKDGSQWGAFLVLAGEMLSLLAILLLLLRALLVWQG